MPTYLMEPPPRRGVPWTLVVAAIVVLGVAAALLVWGFTRPVTVKADGVQRTVPSGSAVSALADAGYLTAKPGPLISVTGKVIRGAGGGPIVVVRNGERVAVTQRLYDGDVIDSRDGARKVEAEIKVKEPIPIETRVEGSGAILKLAKTGSPGIREVVKGQISGAEVASRTIRPASDMVLVATSPTHGDKLVALTFDDGPWPGQTEKILDILKQNRVHATFFMLGGRVKLAPALAKRVAKEGHLLGSHSLSHSNLTKVRPAEVKRQIASGNSTIRRATGISPIWFRPPYGAINGQVWKESRAEKINVVLWDIDSQDWKKPGVDRLVRNATKHVKPGSIILMHDGGVDRKQTIAALPKIIAVLKAKGYSIVTVDEIAAAK